MPATFTLTDDDGGRVLQDGNVIRTKAGLMGSVGTRSFGLDVIEDGATTPVRVPYAVRAVTDASRTR